MGPSGEDDQPGLTRLQLVRMDDGLPEGFPALRAEADAEGHRHMSRLAAEVAETPQMFTVLLAARLDGDLVGVGGLTPEPADPSAHRMRRLFVSARARRRGVARTLANALLHEALQHTRHVTFHAGNPDAALRFGATDTIDPTREDVVTRAHELTEGIGVDDAFDAVGAAPLVETCIWATRNGGTTVLVGAAPLDQNVALAPASTR